MRVDISSGYIITVCKNILAWGKYRGSFNDDGWYAIIRIPIPYIKRTHNPNFFGTSEYCCNKVFQIALLNSGLVYRWIDYVMNEEEGINHVSS